MKKGKTTTAILLAGIMILLSAGCSNTSMRSDTVTTERSGQQNTQTESSREPDAASVTEGTEEYRGFTLDHVLHSEEEGDIHFNLYVPDSYDGSEPYALFFTLPGYEGLYFQGVGENLYNENFGFEAMDYNSNMIIVAPQLEDWGKTSADQTIELVEYFLANYNIDEDKAYENLHDRYLEEGLSEDEINEILVLDIKDASYFESRGMNNQHGGGGLFAEDKEIMGWLFGK